MGRWRRDKAPSSPKLSFSDAEDSHPMHMAHENEDGEGARMIDGRTYLIGNCVVLEFADSMKAADAYMWMKQTEEGARFG